MGILSRSTATVRHLLLGSPSTPSLSYDSKYDARHSLFRKIAFRTTGVLAVASVVGVAGAAQANDPPSQNPATNQTKSASIEITPTNESSAQSTIPTVDTNTTSTSSVHVSNSSGNGNSSVQATVNGQSIEIPQNGTKQQTITTPDGNTNVTITNNTSGQGTNFSSSMTSTSVHSTSTTNDVNITGEHVYGSP